MCGLLFGLDNNLKSNLKNYRRLAKLINHRGPDNTGEFINKNFFFIHKRLSIIDTSEKGHNPVFNSLNNVMCCLNGMIYNYKDLKKDLEQDFKFKSNSDTEVLLYSYIKWGNSFILKLKGMFAFVIYDFRSGDKVLIARDRLGIKPLYFLKKNNLSLYSSELKTLKKVENSNQINIDYLNEFLNFNYPLDCTQSFYNNIKLIEPGTLIEIFNGKETVHKYWNYHLGLKSKINFRNLSNKIIREHLSADVKYASTLSSGIDSSLVSILAKNNDKNIDTFTIGFRDSDLDESRDSFIFTKKNEIQNKTIFFSKSKFFNFFREASNALEEPRVGISVQNYYLYKKIGQLGFKVLLNGIGGDELFAGYTWRYQINQRNFFSEHYKKIFRGNFNLFLNDDFKIAEDEMYEKYKKIISSCSNSSALRRCLEFETKTFLHSLLLVEDKLSMKSSIEARSPLLDNDIIDYSLTLPDNELLVSNQGKFPLRKLLSDLTGENYLNTKKKGFIVPINDWINKDIIEDFFFKKKNTVFFDFFNYKKMKKNLYLYNRLNKNFFWNLASVKSILDNF